MEDINKTINQFQNKVLSSTARHGNTMANKKCYMVRTIPEYNLEIVETEI